MGIFEQIFGTELGLPARAVVALVLVLALIALTVWLMRRFGETRVTGSAAGRNRQQRLAVLDTAVVDARRRLVLIRRDNVEHLILIGGPTDVVVEPNIVRAAPAGGAARPAARPGGYEAEDETPIAPHTEPEPERASPPAPTPRQPAPASHEPPRTMPRPTPQRVDPQYADMAQRLEAALRKPAGELDVPRASPPPPPPMPRPAEPRAPEPRVFEPRPVTAPAPRAPAPAPRPPEPRAAEPPRAPEPRPVQPAQPAQAAPAQQQGAADVFTSLEEEMASLLRPGKKDTK